MAAITICSDFENSGYSFCFCPHHLFLDSVFGLRYFWTTSLSYGWHHYFAAPHISFCSQWKKPNWPTKKYLKEEFFCSIIESSNHNFASYSDHLKIWHGCLLILFVSLGRGNGKERWWPLFLLSKPRMFYSSVLIEDSSSV